MVRQPCQRTPPPPCKTLIEFPFDTKSSFPFLTPSPLPKDIAIQAQCRCEACRSHQCAVLVAGCQNNSILTTERTFNRSTLIGRLCFRCRSRSIHKDNGNFLRVTEPGRPPGDILLTSRCFLVSYRLTTVRRFRTQSLTVPGTNDYIIRKSGPRCPPELPSLLLSSLFTIQLYDGLFCGPLPVVCWIGEFSLHDSIS